MSVAGRNIHVLTYGCGFALSLLRIEAAHGHEEVSRPPLLTAFDDAPCGAKLLLNAVVMSQAVSFTSLLETMAGLLRIIQRLVLSVSAKRVQFATSFCD